MLFVGLAALPAALALALATLFVLLVGLAALPSPPHTFITLVGLAALSLSRLMSLSRFDWARSMLAIPGPYTGDGAVRDPPPALRGVVGREWEGEPVVFAGFVERGACIWVPCVGEVENDVDVEVGDVENSAA